MRARARHPRILGRTLAGALLIGALAAAPVHAALPAQLTVPGWRALSAANGLTDPTVAACDRLATGSSDAQARGAAGICVDGAEEALWSEHLSGDCTTLATETACGADVSGFSSDLSAQAAWARWFTEQLASGGCRSFFAYLASTDGAFARSGEPLAADLHAGRPPTQLRSDLKRWLDEAGAISQSLQAQGGTLYLDEGACKPVA